MSKIPKFILYGENDPLVEKTIQPHLSLRSWSELDEEEKTTALQEVKNWGWIDEFSSIVLWTIEDLNRKFLRICPGKNLHKIIPDHGDGFRRHFGNIVERRNAAVTDFTDIFLNENKEALVFKMLSVFSKYHIDNDYYKQADKETNDYERRKLINKAFETFDQWATCLNHIFEQYSINVVLTRNGLVPRQDERITEEIYVPTLRILEDPKWKNVSNDLAEMFSEYSDENYPEVITKAHSAVQRFLQILVGKEGKSGKGEVGKLFKKAKTEGIISTNRFTEPIIKVFQSFISSERATKSTAKPAMKSATSSDALLVMNVVMILLQHCLQENK